MKATIEDMEHLTRDERSAVQVIESTINTPSKCNSYEDALGWLKCFGGWFVYQGGRHIALHKASGCPRRIMIVTEEGAR